MTRRSATNARKTGSTRLAACWPPWVKCPTPKLLSGCFATAPALLKWCSQLGSLFSAWVPPSSRPPARPRCGACFVLPPALLPACLLVFLPGSFPACLLVCLSPALLPACLLVSLGFHSESPLRTSALRPFCLLNHSLTHFVPMLFGRGARSGLRPSWLALLLAGAQG